MSNPSLAVGQKVLLNDGRPATVRFKGITSFAPGDWVGVELEEPSGKNDGSVQGQKYFDCEDKHGMFLRATGITKVVDKAPTKAASDRPPNGAAVTKGRPSSTVIAGRTTRTVAPNGRGRESLVASPTPARGAAGRMSSIKSPLTSPTKQLSTAGSSASSRTSTPPVPRGGPSAAKSRTSLAPSTSAAGRRTSTITPSSTLARGGTRPSTMGARPGARTTTGISRAGAPSVGAGKANAAARLSDNSHTSATSRTSTEDRNAGAEGRSPALSPGSDDRAPSDDAAVDGTAESGSEREAGSEKEDTEATPRAARTGNTTRDMAPSRTPSTQSLSPTISTTSYRPSTARSAATASREIEDLQTKLRVLEKRRLEDREKLKNLERLQQERDRFESIIQKLQQKYQPQQQELADLKRQLKETEERFSSVENIQADYDAELENAALDREMAEEQYEAAKTELAALREKYEEMELELDILREENQELGKEMSPEERSSQGWLQLERSNERYREALIRLRDVTQDQEAELKQHIAALEKDLEQLSGINEEAEALKVKLLESEAAIDDLKQQLEVAQGGEEMLEELSERNMTLQERIDDLNATIEDLENLKELNDELEINHIEAEKGMQEEIDFKDSVINDQLRRSQEQQKAIDDYEMTVARFREAFRNLQADLEDMRSSKQITDTEAEDLNSKSRALIDLNMKLQASASKTQIKTLDLELQRLEAEESAEHLAIVKLFLPESYQADRDSVLALLRFKRIAFKAELLHGMIKERIADQLGEDLFAGCSVLDRLTWVNAMSHRFISGINACPAEHFARFENALHELEPVERGLNNYIDMLRKEDLQLKRIDSEVERSMAVMSHLASTLLSESPSSFADEVVMKTLMLQSHLENTASALSLCKSFVERHASQSKQNGHVNGDDEQASDEDEDDEDDGPGFGPFFERIESLMSQARGGKVIAGKAHRELLDLRARSMTLQPTSSTDFSSAETSALQIATFARTAGARLASLLDPNSTTSSETSTLTPHSVARLLTTTAKDIFALPTAEPSPLSTLHARLTTLTSTLSDLHSLTTDLTQTTEFPPATPPWLQRAAALKSAAHSSTADRAEIARLSEILAQRNLAVRSKEAELDEQSVRIEMLEARMREAAKRTGRIEELEGLVKEREREEGRLRGEVERLKGEARRLREERDEARRRAGESEGRRGKEEDGVAVVGKAGRLELERRRVQVEGLRAAVRFLNRGTGGAKVQGMSSQVAAEDDLDWLKAPLVRPVPEEVRRAALVEKEAGDVMFELLNLTNGAKPIDLTLGEGKDRLKWRPARETSAWILSKRREDLAVWSEWKDEVVRKAVAFNDSKKSGRRSAAR